MEKKERAKMTTESLTKTIDSLNFARADLLGALAYADAVEALLIQDLIENLMPVITRTNQLLGARDAKE